MCALGVTILLLLPLLLLLRDSAAAGAPTTTTTNTSSTTQCTSACANVSASQACDDCCYDNFPSLEPLTSRDWWNNDILVTPRQDWFRKRQPYDPMVNDSTAIIGIVYTFSKSTLKMTVLFPPLYPEESRIANVDISPTPEGNKLSLPCEIQENTWHCLIRIDNLSQDTPYKYLVTYQPDANNPQLTYSYDGEMPQQKGYPKVAGVGCFGPDNTKDKTAFVQAVASTMPDVLALQGDEGYWSNSLGYGFLELIYTIKNLTRSMPTLVQMDDHDYGMPNIWGAGDSGDMSGAGFWKPPCLVNALQQLFMGHMPDPIINTTLLNGITVAFTNFVYGNVDFAVLESRKFKNFVGDSLMGTDQEAWLRDWCSSGNENELLKVALSQTPFGSLVTNATNYQLGRIVPVSASVDSGGYPPAARDRFMQIIEGCVPIILSGDQHLGLAVTYDEYSVAECVSPAVNNDIFWRLNLYPIGQSYVDGFGHPYTLHQVWNVDPSLYNKSPFQTTNSPDAVKRNRTDGFLIVDLDGTTATCEIHSYRVSHEVVWTSTFPAESKGTVSKNGTCYSACSASQSQAAWVCNSTGACTGCSSDTVCPNLCQQCSSGVYGGLPCAC